MTWKLPGYVVEDLLGFGGSGVVWRARVSATGHPVALKRVPVADPAQLQAARAEAALLSTLDHPHLIRLHELVPQSDAVVLVLDLAGGGSLADLLSRRGRLTPGEVIAALAPIGAALAYSHNEGVVHGDVSPANVLFSEQGSPLLADLGVARIVGDCASTRSTPAYVDPAVAAGCTPGTPSDVFMLAAVALHALTGTPVWTGATAADVLAQAAAGEIGGLGDRLAGVPDDMAVVLERALAVEPHLRCNAAEFALDLRHSGEPTPVELSAGRPFGGDAPAEVDSRAGAHAQFGDTSDELDGAARPTFSRPGAGQPPSRPLQLTHGVRAALRPALPPRRRPIRELAGHRAVARAAIAIVVVGVIAAVGMFWLVHRSPDAAPPHAQVPARAAHPSTALSTLPAAPPVALPNVDAGRAAALLRMMDGLREQAFARRDPSLLRRVYVPGPLLAPDTLLLERVVPAGCGLVGVHTAYSSVRVTLAGARVLVTARAALAPSTLTCGAVRSGAAPGEGPTTLRIALVRQDDGYLIASQQALT